MGSPKDVANGIANIVSSVTSMCNVTSNFNSQALKYESEKYGIEKFGQSKFANVNLYDYVMNKKIGNVYYRIPSTFTFKNGKIEGLKFYSTKNFNSDKVGTKEGKICIPIDTRSLNIDIQYTEYSKFSVDLGSVSYAGNGFTASGHLFSEVMFRYGTLMKNDHGFGVNFNLAGLEYYLVTGNSDDYYVISNMNGTFITYKSMSNVSISDLFTDENCSDGSAFWKKESDEEVFRKFIIDKIKGKADEEFGKDIESDKTIFSSVDSNDSKKSDVPIKTTTSLDNPDGNYSFHSYGVLDGNTTTGGNFTFTYEYSVKLNRACGALSSVTVGGKTYENGFINYMDTLDGNCLEFGTPGSYKDNGNKYYIPVDYSQKKVQLKVNNVNLSVAGFPLNYDLTCEIDVDRGALKYVYRSVDVDSPFPKENISSNWKDWYSIEANRSRLSTTFNREPLYEIVINKYDNNDGNAFISKITNYNNVSYTSWNNMRNNNSDGRSSFICGTNNKSGVGFDKAYCSTNYNDSSFCPLGFIGNNCDKRW